MQYLVVIEQGANSYGAYVPVLPGCVAAADTRQEVAALIQEAIELHIEDLKAREAMFLLSGEKSREVGGFK